MLRPGDDVAVVGADLDCPRGRGHPEGVGRAARVDAGVGGSGGFDIELGDAEVDAGGESRSAREGIAVQLPLCRFVSGVIVQGNTAGLGAGLG